MIYARLSKKYMSFQIISLQQKYNVAAILSKNLHVLITASRMMQKTSKKRSYEYDCILSRVREKLCSNGLSYDQVNAILQRRGVRI